MWQQIDPLIDAALDEDAGQAGDVTSASTLTEDSWGWGQFITKADGVIAGLPVVRKIFQRVDPRVDVSFRVDEGAAVPQGTVLGRVEGPMRGLLQAERTALNFLQHLSGIATMTAKYVDCIRGTKARILDTRKTTPMMRVLEKYAVKKGGGENHRFGLFDMVMIKDNHIDAAGSITAAVERCLAWMKQENRTLPIEVETRTLEEVREALSFPIQRIMLDNMDLETMRIAMREIDGRIECEASGNITLDNVRAVAETGVDYISVGALTHSVMALDISFKIFFQSKPPASIQ